MMLEWACDVYFAPDLKMQTSEEQRWRRTAPVRSSIENKFLSPFVEHGIFEQRLWRFSMRRVLF